MLELLIIGGFLHFGGVYTEGLKCAGAYSVWNFVRGGAYFRNFVSHKKNFLHVCAPCMVHLVDLGTASSCHQGHTGA